MIESGRALIIRGNQILMMFRYNHGKVYFTIPGGTREDNESIEQTTKREVAEETKVKIKLLQKLTEAYDEKHDKKHYLFLANYIEGEPILEESVETQRMKEDVNDFYKPMWVNIEEIRSIKIAPLLLEDFVRNYTKEGMK